VRRLLKIFEWIKSKICKKGGWDVIDTGWLLTIGIEILIIFIGLQSDQIDQQDILKFDQFINLKPSEMGEAFAGIFSALALIWIIVTVFVQSQELKMTRDEFERMADAQSAQTDLLVQRGEIFLDEQRDRKEARAHRTLERKLEFVRDNLARLAEVNYPAAYFMGLIPLFRDEDGFRRNSTREDDVIPPAFERSAPLDEAFMLLADRSRTKLANVQSFVGPRAPARDVPEKFVECLQLLGSILEMKGDLSDEDLIYISKLGINEMRQNWLTILDCIGFQQ
jgi:hypothetical protein